MKTSNYILSAFFIFITVSLLVLFISSKEHHKNDESSFIYKEYSLDNFNVIVAEDCDTNIQIRTSDKNYLSINYPKDKSEPEGFYRISNDTLFIYGSICQDKNIGINDIYVKQLNSVIAKDSRIIRFLNFHSNKLEVNTTNTEIFFDKSSLEEVILTANASKITNHETNLTSVIVLLNRKSRFYSRSKHINKIDLKGDSNSQINIY